MSRQAKAKRDSVILKQHGKGLSGNAIDVMYGLSKDLARSVIKSSSTVPGIADSVKTGENTLISQASTERGTETLDPQGIYLYERTQLLAEAMNGPDEDSVLFDLDDGWTESNPEAGFNILSFGFIAKQGTNAQAHGSINLNTSV